ncbi:MerR family transcriptional regulator [bacterium D16-51]|nr:MerR family transcriptional regulator [bacterium D16-59]RKI58855.1 MerR family transcriptional regulator [bacterium D16-51]
MRTVKELAQITGISVRTLHYYDEIGLLTPTGRSEAGYRLYDDKALEILRQILFFREFDISLREIKSVMENPALDKKQILQIQRTMLTAKKERLERLIASIDDILKGENNMDFEVFSKTEVEEIFHSMIHHMDEEQKNVIEKQFGSINEFHKHFMKNAAKEETQKSWAKIIEWHGNKEHALETAKNPLGEEMIHAFRLRLEAVMDKLVQRKKEGFTLDSFEIREIVAEYGFVQKQLFRITYEKDIMLQLADLYQNNKEVQAECDNQYGEGVAEFFAKAIQHFYEK